MRVLILGASGIVGQHMRLSIPTIVEPVWVRRTAGVPGTLGVNLEDPAATTRLLNSKRPDVVVNLAGEGDVEKVERDPAGYRQINVGLPLRVAEWCEATGSRLIQVSSQAVFEGNMAPYRALDLRGKRYNEPVNQYGKQKRDAECLTLNHGAEIVRLSFILGVRPDLSAGRKNPLESMMAGQSPQVADRWFSPLSARDAARSIWRSVTWKSGPRIIQVASPERVSRYDIAKLVNPSASPCSHSDFVGCAPRPMDTTYHRSSVHWACESLGAMVRP